jgi:hypothetical protein
MRIEGIDKVMRNLNRELKQIKGRSMNGLIRATIIIRRSMEDTPPLIPVDEGNLRASWFTVSGDMRVNSDGGFIGDNAAKMSTDHRKVISAEKGKVVGYKHPVVAMGFSANYAAPVHEKRGGSIKFKRQGSGPLFFQSALVRNHVQILNVIAESARIK